MEVCDVKPIHLPYGMPFPVKIGSKMNARAVLGKMQSILGLIAMDPGGLNKLKQLWK